MQLDQTIILLYQDHPSEKWLDFTEIWSFFSAYLACQVKKGPKNEKNKSNLATENACDKYSLEQIDRFRANRIVSRYGRMYTACYCISTDCHLSIHMSKNSLVITQTCAVCVCLWLGWCDWMYSEYCFLSALRKVSLQSSRIDLLCDMIFRFLLRAQVRAVCDSSIAILWHFSNESILLLDKCI